MLPRVFAGVFGAFLGLALLKFGNPPIMDKWVSAPRGFFEFLALSPWPAAWAYWMLVCVCLGGLLVAHWRAGAPGWLLVPPLILFVLLRFSAVLSATPEGWAASPWPVVVGYWLLMGAAIAATAATRWIITAPRWLVALPALWLGWQLVAAARTVDAQLSLPTLHHLIACVLCFYLGLFGLSRAASLWPFWIGLMCGFLLVLAMGLDQRFGGLDQSRKYFLHQLELYPQMQEEVPPEFLKKVSSNRIYSTLFYPNGLAGGLLLLLPPMLAIVYRFRDCLKWNSRSLLPAILAASGIAVACLYLYILSSTAGWAWLLLLGLAALFPVPRSWTAALLGLAGLACLYWSGSKGGWLLMLLLGLVASLFLPWDRRLKALLVAGVLMLGLAGFFWKYSGFFQQGATSVSARFDYWRAALHTAKDKPLFGTGPGTFAIPYKAIKRPESEMARLVHNDYLEQASDSGVIGVLAYTLFIAGALGSSFPFRGLGRTLFTRSARRTCGDVDPPSAVRSDEQANKPPSCLSVRDWQIFSIWLGTLGWALQGFMEFGLYIPALAWPAFALMGWLLGTSPVRPATLEAGGRS